MESINGLSCENAKEGTSASVFRLQSIKKAKAKGIKVMRINEPKLTS